MSNLRDYYERALREFGFSDEGEFDAVLLAFKEATLIHTLSRIFHLSTKII